MSEMASELISGNSPSLRRAYVTCPRSCVQRPAPPEHCHTRNSVIPAKAGIQTCGCGGDLDSRFRGNDRSLSTRRRSFNPTEAPSSLGEFGEGVLVVWMPAGERRPVLDNVARRPQDSPLVQFARHVVFGGKGVEI